MGRAIDMENDIHKLKIQVETMENALERVIETVDRLEAKSPSVKHVELVEDIKPKEIEEEQSVSIKEVEEACEDALDKPEEKDAAEAAAPKKSAKSSKNKK